MSLCLRSNDICMCNYSKQIQMYTNHIMFTNLLLTHSVLTIVNKNKKVCHFCFTLLFHMDDTFLALTQILVNHFGHFGSTPLTFISHPSLYNYSPHNKLFKDTYELILSTRFLIMQCFFAYLLTDYTITVSIKSHKTTC